MALAEERAPTTVAAWQELAAPGALGPLAAVAWVGFQLAQAAVEKAAPAVPRVQAEGVPVGRAELERRAGEAGFSLAAVSHLL